ncbi:hypothetical protein AAF712_016504 [Marasmius tenuissimus]|uniref:Protein kinase domain-containing protein n=1 Tax=Marasmius tenuissimus TaxID=585030 RepID=A0ABR2Z5J6_9AGAR
MDAREAEEHVHPRFCPWISSFELFEDKETRTVEFDYVKLLERGNTCAIFLVRRKDEGRKPAVVKFVRRYNADAHRFMADQGLAPALIHYGELGGGYATDLRIVVMDHVVGRTLHEIHGEGGDLPDNVKSAIRNELMQLNDRGFIFPDLRWPNVMMTTTAAATADDGDMKGRLRFIDLDWVCEKDKGMRYPLHLTQVLREKAGAKDYDVITLEHQKNLFENL